MELFWAYSADFSPRRGDSGPFADAGPHFAIQSPTTERKTTDAKLARARAASKGAIGVKVGPPVRTPGLVVDPDLGRPVMLPCLYGRSEVR